MPVDRTHAEQYASTLGLPTNQDHDYQKHAMSAMNANAKKRFVHTSANYQSTVVATKHGLVHGAYYGGIVGFASAVYYRRMRQVPVYALGMGAGYGFLLGASAWFRMDI